MKYEVGQKVETPLGVGEIKKIETWHDGHIQFVVWINDIGVRFLPRQLKPYKTPQEKLIEMGFSYIANHYDYRLFYNEKTKEEIYIYHNKKYDANINIDLKLSRILTDYLEWLEEGNANI